VVVEPRLDWYILGRTPEQNHRSVSMGVDQPWQRNHSSAADNLASFMGRDLAGRLQGNNLLAADKDVVSQQNVDAVRLRVDDENVLDQEIVHWPSGCRSVRMSILPRGVLMVL
jgi:hypothetical protein